MLFLSCSVFAQPIIKVDSVDIIEAKDYGIRFAKKQGEKYKQIEVDLHNYKSYEGSLPEKFSAEVDYTYNYKDSADFFYSAKNRLIPVNQIKQMSEPEFQSYLTSNEWIIKEKNEGSNKQQRFIKLKEFSGNILMLQHYFLEDNSIKAFEVQYHYQKRYEKKMYRVKRADFFNYCIVDLGHNRRIVLLLSESSVGGCLIPLSDSNNIYCSIPGITVSSVAEKKVDDSWKHSARELHETISSFEPRSFYFPAKLGNKKYGLINLFYDTLLPFEYDSIKIENDFIIANKEHETIVYNMILEKLNISNIKTYHITDRIIHVISKNKYKQYDVKGEKPYPFKVTRSVCGSTNAMGGYGESYTLKTDSAGYNFIDVKLWSYYGQRVEMKKVYFANTMSGYRLYSLSGTKNIQDNHKYKYKGWLFAFNKDNKFGIVKYNFAKVASFNPNMVTLIEEKKEDVDDKYYANEDDRPIKKIKLDGEFRYQNQYDTLTEILPVVYHTKTNIEKISLPVRIYKDGLVGLYPINSDVQYTYLGKLKGGYFLRFVLPDGKKGWLNIDGKEYLDSK